MGLSMLSRVWLAAAFVIAFGVSPAHAATGAWTAEPPDVLRVPCACKPDDVARKLADDLATSEPGDDPASVAEGRGRVAVAE
jgi:hypothetical protein